MPRHARVGPDVVRERVDECLCLIRRHAAQPIRGDEQRRDAVRGHGQGERNVAGRADQSPQLARDGTRDAVRAGDQGLAARATGESGRCPRVFGQRRLQLRVGMVRPRPPPAPARPRRSPGMARSDSGDRTHGRLEGRVRDARQRWTPGRDIDRSVSAGGPPDAGPGPCASRYAARKPSPAGTLMGSMTGSSSSEARSMTDCSHDAPGAPRASPGTASRPGRPAAAAMPARPTTGPAHRTGRRSRRIAAPRPGAPLPSGDHGSTMPALDGTGRRDRPTTRSKSAAAAAVAQERHRVLGPAAGIDGRARSWAGVLRRWPAMHCDR